MKNILLVILLSINFNIEHIFAQELKIGYTNTDYILSFLPETKQVQSEVQAYGTQLQNQLQSKVTDFQSKADAFQKTAATMTDLIRADKQEELQNLQASIQKFQNEAQTSIAQKEQDLFKPLFEKISNAINVVSERENYINKFLTLTEGILDKKESNRFLKTVQNLRNLKSGQLHKLNIEVRRNKLKRNNKKGIF